MIVVLSDLHFQDTRLEPDGMRSDPNVPAESLDRFFRGVARRIEDDIRAGRKIREVTFLLAGDIFELHRTERWFSTDPETGNPDGLRPYYTQAPLNLRDPRDRGLDLVIARIMGGILHRDGAAVPQKPPEAAHDPNNSIALGALTPAMETLRDAWKTPERYRFPVPVKFAYLPGNHDRMINLSPTAARAVRELLGMKREDAAAQGGWRFPHRFVDPKHGIAVRHGHEYDGTNCEYFLARPRSVLTEDLYDRATIGDLVTVDIASRLPHVFRADHANALDPEHHDGLLYRRIREIDDLRPLGSIVDWILYSAEDGLQDAKGRLIQGKALWKEKLSPVLARLVLELSKNKFLAEWVSRHNKKGADRMDVLQAALSRPSMRALGRMTLGSAGVIRMLLKATTSDRDAGRMGPASLPDLERTLEEELTGVADRGDAKYLQFLVSGHTHNPGVEALKSTHAGDRDVFTIDTGTWRRLIRRCRDGKSFATTRMATYAIFYADDEGPGHRFQVWTGVTAGE